MRWIKLPRELNSSKKHIFHSERVKRLRISVVKQIAFYVVDSQTNFRGTPALEHILDIVRRDPGILLSERERKDLDNFISFAPNSDRIIGEDQI